MGEVHEFDVMMTVRKRLHIAGPRDRKYARELLEAALNGGANPNMFAKRDSHGYPIESVVLPDFEITDPTS